MHIIGEVGSNHCGSLDLACAHIKAAAECGCTGVKFQLFRPELLDSRPEMVAELGKWALPPSWIGELARASIAQGLAFICTPFDVEAVGLLGGYVDMVKVSAYDLTYDALVGAAAGLGVPVILSTAMARLREVEHAVRVVEQVSSAPITLLQGVAQYPCRLEDMNLQALAEMRRWLPECEVGISDHTPGTMAALLSVALGGTMIEKHFKCNDTIVSPDAPHSATPAELRTLVALVHEAEQALGSGRKRGPLPCEMPLFETCRRTNDKPLRG